MRRLPEQFDRTDPNEAYGASLLAQIQPLHPSAMRKRRVWVALQRAAMTRPRNRATAVVAVAVVFCCTTAASATMTKLWKRFYQTPLEPAPISHSVQKAARPSPPVAAPAVPAPVIQQPQSLPVAPKPTLSKSRAVAIDPADPASAALMVQAMQARRAGNFGRVRELSAEYRLKYPNGALHEEALALSIEAAAALGEEDAPRLSATYLQRYPRGRFRGQAQRALGAAR